MLEAEDIFGEEPESDELTEPPARKVPDALAKGSITAKQEAFLTSLLRERAASQGDPHIAHVQNMDKRTASYWIGVMLERPKLNDRRVAGTGSTLPSPEVLPAGRYAVNNERGELCFYKVWRRPQDPEFVKLYLQHGPDDTELPFRAMATILQKMVDEGPIVCARRYGQEIKHCCICNRRLTARISRALGIGPVCGARIGGREFEEEVSEVRAEMIEQGLDPDEVIDDE